MSYSEYSDSTTIHFSHIDLMQLRALYDPDLRTKNELQKLEEAKEGVTVIQVKYSDTDAMFDKQVKNALREFGIPEDVIQQQNFKYG